VTADDLALVARLPEWAFASALVLARAGSACMLLPGIGEMELPQTVRAGFALALSAMLLPVLAPALPAAPGDPARLAAMLGGEIAAGLFLGWLVRLLLLALPMAGQLAALLVGQASVLQPDEMLGPETAALARLLGLAAPVVILAGNLHALPLRALMDSYRLLPAGAPLASGDMAQTALGAVSACVALAVRLAAPLILVGIVWNVTLAAISRLAPQVQVFFLAAPAQLLGGLALLGLLGGAMLALWQERFQAGFANWPGG
jgi:flagellar biosynthetic protein FliR